MSSGRGPIVESTETLLDASPDSIFLVDDAGRIAYVNDRVTDLFGYSPGELLGEPIERVVPAEFRESHVRKRQAYVNDPELRPMGAELDLRGLRKDGKTVPIDVSLSPVDVDGERYVIAVVRDVSAQVELRTQYRTILEAVPDAVIIAETASGEIVEANDVVAELLGYDPSELIGQTQDVLHPADDAAAYTDLFERHIEEDQSIVTQLPDGSDIYIETATGETIPVEINAHVFELAARELVVGVFRDIRLRKQRTQALERLHSASRDLMNATTTEEVAALASETAAEILDLSMNGVHLYDADADALVPIAWSDSVEQVLGDEPPVIPAGEGLAWEVYRRGDPEIHGDTRASAAVLNDETPFRSELYLPLGAYGVLVVGSTDLDDFDVTDATLAQVLAANTEAAFERVEREEELRRRNERLDTFAGILSHDLRNPLNVAAGRLDLARSACDCPNEHFEHIERAHSRMEALVEDLLTVARSGGTVSAVESVSLREVIETCWLTVETGDATLVVEADRTIRAAENRLKQLFENLIRNAIEHGGDDVIVTVGARPDGFFLEDDGPGFGDVDRDRLFEMGYSTSKTGTGFGLAIVEEVATAHDWSVFAGEGRYGGARLEFTGVDIGE